MIRAVLRWAMRNSIDAELAGLSEWVRHGLHASDTVGGAAGTMLLSQSTALRDLYEAPPPAVSVAELAVKRAARSGAAGGSLLKEVAARAAQYGRGVRPADGAAAAAMECQQEREAERQEENEAVREVRLPVTRADGALLQHTHPLPPRPAPLFARRSSTPAASLDQRRRSRVWPYSTAGQRCVQSATRCPWATLSPSSSEMRASPPSLGAPVVAAAAGRGGAVAQSSSLRHATS